MADTTREDSANKGTRARTGEQAAPSNMKKEDLKRFLQIETGALIEYLRRRGLGYDNAGLVLAHTIGQMARADHDHLADREAELQQMIAAIRAVAGVGADDGR